MPNHAHLIFTPLPRKEGDYVALARIMHGVKGYSGWKANDILGLREPFWQHESYDHYIRDQNEFARIIKYVLENPVKAGLVDSWEKWPWNYLKLME
jgi:REP element-mobilizing transposase RayT